MRRNPLGTTGLEVSQLGYGSMGIRGPNTWGVRVVDEDQADRILNEALDAGINFIDTAPDYGLSEERIGRFLARRRDEFILATKCGCDPIQHQDHLEIRHTFTAETIRRNLETSLRRLKTDRIDLMQFHGGTLENLQAAGLVDLLEEFRKEGKIRCIGVSSVLPHLEDFVDSDLFDTIQVPYSCLAPQHDELIRRAAEKGLGIIIRGGIAQGGPEAEIQREPIKDAWQAANLDELLSEGMTKAELILRATLSHPGCQTTIVGTCNSSHLQANVAAANRGALPPKILAETSRRTEKGS